MTWAFKWQKDLSSGFYYDRLLPMGLISEEDMEPVVDGLDFYLDAFRELSSCRPSGLDLSPIPFTAIAEYSRIYDIDDLEEFAYLMRRMDDCLLNLNAAKRETNATSNANAPNNDKR